MFISVTADGVYSQIEPPDREFLFFEDRARKKDEKKRQRELQEKQRKARRKQLGDLPFDLNAPNITFDSAANTVRAEGGLLLSYGSAIMEAERGALHVDSREAELAGDVRFSDLAGDLLADAAKLNLDTGVGSLTNPSMKFQQGGFRVIASEARKVAQDDYEFDNATLTTCECPDDEDCRPWSLRAKTAAVTRNGYGEIWNGSIAVYDVPVFYIPYLIFPALTERQTGLLPATFGNSNTYGFEMFAPLFIAIDRSADATLTYVLQSKVRTGVESEYRQIFSKGNRLDVGLTYLNEQWRDEGDLLGTDLTGIYDPEIKKQRFAGYLDARVQGDLLGQRIQFLVDGNYVNDNLILREFEQRKIGEASSRFVPSTALVRTDLFGTYSAELVTSYDQGLLDNQKLLFQELPTFDIVGLHIFRPFGENPLGAKVVLRNEFTSTNFYRDVGYDGFRHELYENVKVPFHVKNYVDFVVAGDLRGTLYDLDNTRRVNRDSGQEEEDNPLPATSDRIVPGVDLKASTVLEKVTNVGEGSIFKYLAELGEVGRREQLVRVKHTIEPVVKYRFVPEVDQDDNPQFDSYDQLKKKNVVTYGVVQRVYGRFEPRDRYLYGIEETTPELSDIPSLQTTGPIDADFGFGLEPPVVDQYRSIRSGSPEELAMFAITQSYDINEAKDDENTDRNAFSNVALSTKLLPNEYFRVGAATNVNLDNTEFDSYRVETQLLDKRGDELRARVTFIKDNFRQLEGGLQLSVTDRLKLGYYTRYDDFSGEFIENKFGVRLHSRCARCWTVDVTFADRTNPNETNVLVTLTLLGLGELRDKFFTDQLSKKTPSSRGGSS